MNRRKDDHDTLESLAQDFVDKKIDYATFLAKTNEINRRDHEKQYPNGCPAGSCEDCVKRLGGWGTCTMCKRNVPHIRGVALPHQPPLKGKPGYSAKHFAQFASDCNGSGRRVK